MGSPATRSGRTNRQLRVGRPSRAGPCRSIDMAGPQLAQLTARRSTSGFYLSRAMGQDARSLGEVRPRIVRGPAAPDARSRRGRDGDDPAHCLRERGIVDAGPCSKDSLSELVVQSALCATRARLVRQLVCEAIVLGGAASIVGAAFAAVGFRWLVAAMPLGAWAETAALDWRVFGARRSC